MPTPQPLKQLQLALISAFPDKPKLDQLLYFGLGRNLNQITQESNLQTVVFQLIQTAESQGWLIELVRAACKENSGNVELAAIASELLPETSQSKLKILILANASKEEYAQRIEAVIKKVIKQNSFEIRARTIKSPEDIPKFVAEERPFIVHFYSHNTKDGDLVLNNNLGNDSFVKQSVLVSFFRAHNDVVKCILLSVPYSFHLAKAISRDIDYVIGMEGVIDEENATTTFAQEFYRELDSNNHNNSDVIPTTIPTAFNKSIAALGFIKIGTMPDLWRNKGSLQVGDLRSDRNVDYTRLRDLLKAGNWKDADYETYLVMLKVVGREEDDWIRPEEFLNFPCTDLRTIDSLWVKYSNGRFGFSVQKKIYLDVGVADDKFYEESWEKLSDRVGWKVKESWIPYNEVTFDTKATVGHLPHLSVMMGVIAVISLGRGMRVGRDVVGIMVAVLFSRIETCEL
ncbi:GUN4 domain-containing protein [Aetokthonos hydrillicola]|jgi:hypothetical protein|uniref:GUN4 domain-containing protein n=1 Tax=Aetokthonos hydrillicola TaxID=1550245 RepID=UPI0028773BAA|nr:GUN4 domain-containing protein [Aetokthonos hydrillicola]